jgi:hypothetical protein
MADDLERAKIAVEEYKVLHAELLQRANVLVQMCGACIGAMIALVGLTAAGTIPWQAGVSLVLAVLVVALAVWQMVDSDARNVCKRIGEIEEYVNRAVGGDDFFPLSWERRFGILKRTYVHRWTEFQEPGVGEQTPKSVSKPIYRSSPDENSQRGADSLP